MELFARYQKYNNYHNEQLFDDIMLVNPGTVVWNGMQAIGNGGSTIVQEPCTWNSGEYNNGTLIEQTSPQLQQQKQEWTDEEPEMKVLQNSLMKMQLQEEEQQIHHNAVHGAPKFVNPNWSSLIDTTENENDSTYGKWPPETEGGYPPSDLSRVEKILWLDRQEQNNNSKWAIIRGIPVKENENLYNIVLNIGKYLQIDLTNKIYTVQRCGKYHKMERPIEVSFYKSTDKRKLIHKRKEYYSFTTKDIGFEEKNVIHINELLTARRYRLFGLMKSLQKEKKYYKIWVKDGELYIKPSKYSTTHCIQHEEDLQFLM